MVQINFPRNGSCRIVPRRPGCQITRQVGSYETVWTGRANARQIRLVHRAAGRALRGRARHGSTIRCCCAARGRIRVSARPLRQDAKATRRARFIALTSCRQHDLHFPSTGHSSNRTRCWPSGPRRPSSRSTGLSQVCTYLDVAPLTMVQKSAVIRSQRGFRQQNSRGCSDRSLFRSARRNSKGNES